MGQPIDIFDPSFRNNPYPTYERLRSEPLQQIQPGGFWAISRYEDVEYALKNPQIFSSAAFGSVLRPDWLAYNPLSDSLVVKDGPAHAKLRALLSRAFTPRAIGRLEPEIRAIASDLCVKLGERGEVDFVIDFCSPMSARVIATILGIDPGLHRQFQRWVGHLMLITPIYPGDEMAANICATVAEMEGYLKEVVAARRGAPQDDIVTALTRVELEGSTLADADIISFLFALLVAGFETTMHVLAMIMLDLATRPEEHARLRADPSRIANYIEEMLRKEPPAHGVPRITTVDTEIGGTKLPAGSPVMIMIASANHDPSRFAEPEQFSAARGSQGGLAFGHGVHFCIGAPLARLEARVALEELVSRFQRFERLPGELTWNLAVLVRGLTSLPIRVLRG